MASTKSSVSNIGEALGLKASEFTFLNPPLVDVPFSTIVDLQGNTRQIPDPSKTLKPAMGIERVQVRTLTVTSNEKGPNGERVWVPDNNDPRIRAVGVFDPLSSTYGPDPFRSVTADTGYVEITFYGTGFNWLGIADGGARTWQYSIDGGAYTTFISTTLSGIIGARNYNPNIVLPVVKGLTLGVHTIRIKSTVGSLEGSGFEILNESSQIKIPTGELFSAGRKYTNSSLFSTSYNSGFDGNPILNGRGGRVVQYITTDGSLGKAIQQTNGAAAYLTSTDHTNEELIRKINFREFGANRADDFSTLTDTTDDRAFTLDDGTTTLVGDNVRTFANANFPSENLYLNQVNPYGVTLTFVGTGLDVIMTFGSAAETTEVLVDGALVGTIPFATLTRYKHIKICSGLPYGTHTVTIRRAGPLLANYAALHDFYIYGPKKPSIPSNAHEISEYYLMADYDGSTITGTAITDQVQRPRGVLQKVNTREYMYVGSYTVGGSNDIENPSGAFIFSTTLNNYYEYTFFGTGFVIHQQATTSGIYTFEVQVDGVANATGVARSNVTNAGSGNYTTTTTVGNSPVRVEFTGLPLGLHTVRSTLKTAARNFGGGCIFVITPVHFPNTKAGSLGMGPSLQLQKDTLDSGIDLGKAKAMIVFDASSGVILESFGVSAALFGPTTGDVRIYFEKPFKNGNYAIAYNGDFAQSFLQGGSSVKLPNYCYLRTTNTTGGFGNATHASLIFFGRLNEEEE